MLVLVAVSSVGLVVDDRVLVGAPIWLKPFKFAVSFTLYGTTLAWTLSLLPHNRPILRRAGWWMGTVIAVFASGDWVIMLTQVARGQMVHFNYATPLDTLMYDTMGLLIMFVWLATLGITILVMITRPGGPATSWALRLGLVISLIGMALGELMNLPTPAQQHVLDQGGVPSIIGAHSVGVPDGGPGMPITYWSTTGGDLRIPHFVGLHGLQAVPLFAILLSLLANRVVLLRDERVRVRLIQVAAGCYAGLVGLVTWQALRGQSLIHPDVLTLAALTTLIALTVAGGWAVVAAGQRRARTVLAVARESVDRTAELTDTVR